jgi:hypothetical protein
MNWKKFMLPMVTFVSGVVIGIGTMALISHPCTSDNISEAGITLIAPGDANTLVNNYAGSEDKVPTEPVKGFYLDTTQLNAMRIIGRQNSSLPGFRIYLGKNSSNLIQGIVVGVDNRGMDVYTGKIYTTTSPNCGPCPWVCDVSSPIIAR